MGFFPEVRLTVWHAMVVMATLAVSLAIARTHLTIGVVTGCVLVLTILRTVMLAQRHRREGEEVTIGRRVRRVLGSLACSVAIIGLACLTFMCVYTMAKHLTRERETHSIPHVDSRAVVLGGLAGLGAGYGIRRWLWEPRARRGGSRNTPTPSA